MKINIKDLKDKLENVKYSSNDSIDYALAISMNLEKPLLLEGGPGVGKSSLAKAVADALELPFIRVQLYDGLTDDKILFDYNYQKQLLTLEAIKPFITEKYEGQDIKDIIKGVSGDLDFYGKDFLIERPILRAINGTGRKVILFDEIDKAPEEIEYMLYEFLENYSITIPEYGEIKCPEDQKPIVFLTSNRYRELSGALKRRCNYLYIKQKTQIEIVNILKLKAEADDSLANAVAKCIIELDKNTGIAQKPSISEAIEWAKFVRDSDMSPKEAAINSLSIIAKNYKDYDAIRNTILKLDSEYLWETE